jgi:Ca2+-binding RTX toxin-like protein
VYTFRVVETFTAAPLNMISGINDMQLVEENGRLMLYTATRAGGGVLALDVGGDMAFADQEALAPGAILSAPARLELLTIGADTRLLVTGASANGVQSFGIEAPGTLSSPLAMAGGLSGVISAQTVVQDGGSTYILLARAGESTIHSFLVGAGGTLIAAGKRVLDDAYPGVDITSLASVSVGGQTYLVSLSLEADVIRTFALGPGGAIGQPLALGAPQGLGIADPSALATVEIGGTSFLIVASAGSSSISVIEVSAGGTMRVADHVIDTLDTRFAAVQALTTVVEGDRVFVIAAGGDGGVEVMALLPEGRLLSVGRQLDLPGLALDNASALTARFVDGRIEVFVAGEGTGITRLAIDIGPLSPMQRAGPGGTDLTGTAGGDLLVGLDGSEVISAGDGADILSDGSGRDTLHGGAGADIHVLCADGETDVIADFQLGTDKIDLSAWGRIHALQTLTITSTATGALIRYLDEVLEIRSANGLPIPRADFRLTDFIGLWHALPPTSMGDGIVGTNQADLLVGTAGNDIFIASDGADTIDGGAGFDFLDLSAAPGAQRVDLTSPRFNSGLTAGQVHSGIEGLTGSRFSDQLTGDAAANWLDGGDGNDRLVGAAGADTLIGSLGIDYLSGGEGGDLLDGGAGFDRAGYSDAKGAVIVDFDTPAANRGDARGDIFIGVEGLEGSDFGDTLRGNAGDNNFLGGDGNDFLEGRNGNDALNGEAGNDTLIGGAGADFLNGEEGFNVASYVTSPVGITLDLADPSRSTGHAFGDRFVSIQRIDASAFADRLSGSTGNDSFAGLAGNDLLSGLGGSDRLLGGAGNDVLYGGSSGDILTGGAGADRIDGGTSFDVASHMDAVQAVHADLASPSTNQGDARGDTYAFIEGLEGSVFSDTLLGDGFANGLWGQGGNDRLLGRSGNDTLRGGDGSDILTGGAGADRLEGGTGFDWASWSDATAGVTADLADWTQSRGAAAEDVLVDVENLIGSAYSDILRGTDGINRLTGGTGNDRLEGRGGTDILDGGTGNDMLDGGTAADTLYGGDGNDRALGGDGDDILYGGAGNDWIEGGQGADVLNGEGGLDVISYAASSEGAVIDLADQTRNGGAAAGDRLTGFEDIRGSVHADRLIGNVSGNILRGEGGSDRLLGGAGNDVLYGGSSGDILTGGAGADRIDGGTSFDVASHMDAVQAVHADLASPSMNQGDARGDTYAFIEGLEGSVFSDTLLGDGFANGLWGQGGNDRLLGRSGNDTLRGGDGSDILTGGAGADRLEGGTGFDWASWSDATAGVTADLADWTQSRGAAAEDVLVDVENLIGSAYSDILRGTEGINRLTGGTGTDRLDGRGGTDILDGGTGNDLLDGGTAADTLYGGDGNDRVLGGDGDDILYGGAGNDWIEGGQGADVLTGGLGRDDFVFAGGHDVLMDFTDGQDRIRMEADLWFGSPPSVADVLAGAVQSQTGIMIALPDGSTLDIRGVFDTKLLLDDFLFV